MRAAQVVTPTGPVRRRGPRRADEPDARARRRTGRGAPRRDLVPRPAAEPGRVPDASPSRRSRSASTSPARWSAADGLRARRSGSPASAATAAPQERVAVPGMFTFPLPDSMSYDEGAALPMNYLTAQFALAERGAPAGRARRCWCTARPAASARPPSRSPRAWAPARSRWSSTEEKAKVARDAGRRRGRARRRLQGRRQGADRRQGRRRGARRRRRRRVHRLAARARHRRAGCSSSASPPGRASPRSRSTGCCSTTSTCAASAGAPSRCCGPATCSSSGRRCSR